MLFRSEGRTSRDPGGLRASVVRIESTQGEICSGTLITQDIVLTAAHCVMHKAGYNVVVESWLGAFVPSKTPAEVVNVLGAAIGEAVKSPQMIENLSKVGNEPSFLASAEFAAKVKADVARWGPVVKASGFVAED